MRHDSGEGAEDVEDGYYIKQGQIEDALHKVGIAGVDTFAYDAGTEAPGQLTEFILEKIRKVRDGRAEAARSTIAAVEEMLANVAQAQALAALETVNRDLQLFADRHKKLAKARRPAYQRLLQAVVTLHARTVWAATRRAGSFWNFDVFQHLGDGAAAEAKLLSSKVVDGLAEVVALRCSDPELKSAHGFLAQVIANVRAWEADFVNAARHHAVAVYRAPLARAQEMWDECEDPYGRGLGQFREHVAGELREWFEDNSELQDELERRVKRAWKTTMIDPLRLAAGAMPSSSEAAPSKQPGQAQT
jgi:DNA-binding protein H-NS